MTARRNLAAVAGGLGLTVTLLSGGIFAVFTDRATTGPNDASTRAEARAADLKLATSDATFNCGPFDDDLATGIISVTDLPPGGSTDPTVVCLRNDGSAAVTIELSVIDLVDLDVACTGDEAAAGDATCGSDQLGEASQALHGSVQPYDCNDGTPFGGTSRPLGETALGPVPLTTLQPGETACLAFSAGYFGGSVASRQIMQSDKVTWRWAFDGTTS